MVNVTISSPGPGATVNLPFPAAGSATTDQGDQIVSAWYQIDANDANNIPIVAGSPVLFSFFIDGLSPGPHVLSVYARTNNIAGANDQNFTVNSSLQNPPGFPQIP